MKKQISIWKHGKSILWIFCLGGVFLSSSIGCKKSQDIAGDNVIQINSTVKMHYTLTVDKEKVDSSIERDPLEFVQGSGQIIPGLETELEGLKAGDTKKVTVIPEKGYGKHNPDAIQEVPRTAFQNSDQLKVGGMVQGQQPNGQMFQAVVKNIEKDSITLDTNHPLAGKTLNFDVEIVEVEAPK